MTPRNGESVLGLQVLGFQVLGLLLFLFIPVVLFLFVVHPEPLAGSLVGGVVLMLAHRFLARPYMGRVAQRRCLWTGGSLANHETEPVELGTLGEPVAARVRSRHARDLRRFFTFVYRRRLALRVGIFLPLLVLLGTLAAAAVGQAGDDAVATATNVFRLVIGLTVNFAAWGWLTVREPDAEIRVPFPVHNFFLLGVRALLWIFRLVGIWWIWAGASGLLLLAAPAEAQDAVLQAPQEVVQETNALNAEHFPALVSKLEERGYRFVTLDEALEDPAYDAPDAYAGPGGITWIHRWAITRGVDPAMFRGEPATPEWVQDIAGFRE